MGALFSIQSLWLKQLQHQTQWYEEKSWLAQSWYKQDRGLEFPESGSSCYPGKSCVRQLQSEMVTNFRAIQHHTCFPPGVLTCLDSTSSQIINCATSIRIHNLGVKPASRTLHFIFYVSASSEVSIISALGCQRLIPAQLETRYICLCNFMMFEDALDY
jgi:hypothetical protein